MDHLRDPRSKLVDFVWTAAYGCRLLAVWDAVLGGEVLMSRRRNRMGYPKCSFLCETAARLKAERRVAVALQGSENCGSH